ncbi:hypothetical protein [Providencia hangzhouensis]|uniref:hypothetical protein n=1 Tax=Providencia hangzhouensis TaxID=3031799 RepID=UPI0034DD8210
MKNIDPENGAYIFGTCFAIDRHISTDDETGATFVYWRMLELDKYSRIYKVMDVNSNPLEILQELVSSHTKRYCKFKSYVDYLDTVVDITLTCNSAIEGIQQRAVFAEAKHG